MANRGGDTSAKARAAGHQVGRPKKESAVAKKAIRRDVAFEVLEVLNVRFRKRDEVRAKATPEAQLILGWILNDGTAQNFRWDVYRYVKECVDMKPMIRSEEKVVWDPSAPIRVIVEHIGPGSA